MANKNIRKEKRRINLMELSFTDGRGMGRRGSPN